MSFNAAMQEILEVSEDSAQEGTRETFERDMSSTLGSTADKAIKAAGRALSHLKPADRQEIVRGLYGRGFFLIKGSVRVLAEELHVSKFSIYNYLEQVKGENGSSHFRSP